MSSTIAGKIAQTEACDYPPEAMTFLSHVSSEKQEPHHEILTKKCKTMFPSNVFTILKGDIRVPLLAHIPHSSTCIPSGDRDSFMIDDDELKNELLVLTDWYVGEIYESVPKSGGISVVYNISRLIVDPERFEDDNKEEMYKRGMGVIYTKTSVLSDLRKPPSKEGKEAFLNRYYRPYHSAIENEVHTLLKEFDSCLILDCHSFSSRPLPYEYNQDIDRPDVCIGTDSFHTPIKLIHDLSDFFFSKHLNVSLNKPFQGTYVPAKFFKEEVRVKSVMIEINRGRYMDEESGLKVDGFYKVKDEIDNLIDFIIDNLPYE